MVNVTKSSPASNRNGAKKVCSTDYQQLTNINLTAMPSTGLINIEIDGQPLDNDAKVEIYNLHGQLIISQNQQNASVDVGHLSKGIYLLKVVTRTKTGVGRINLH